jgi:sorting nexin-27
MLPDRSVIVFKINRFSTADKVYEVVVEKIGLPKECLPYFYLFEIIDYNFGKNNFQRKLRKCFMIDLERKLRPNEYPHQIYVQNCCTANTTCLCFRKFVFSPNIENQLLKYPLARDYLYREVRYSVHDSFCYSIFLFKP